MPIIRDIIYGAVACGANLTELCRSCGVSRDDLNDSGKKMEFVQAFKVWEHAVKQTGNKLLGLHLGMSTHPSILGLVGHLMQSSATLKVSFQHVCKYSELATTMFQYKIMEKADMVLLEFKPAGLWVKMSPDTARQAVEQAMAGTLHVFQLLSGKKLFPHRAEFAYRRPAPLKEYEAVFNTSLTFNAKSNRLVFHAADLNQSVLSYDQSLVALFDNLLKERLDKMKRVVKLSEQTKAIILTEFKGQVPPAEIIASTLNLTVRTFQRRLSEEGLTLRQLTESIRNELATRLMKQERVKGSEVARILGYSDASAFRRAFRKWKEK